MARPWNMTSGFAVLLLAACAATAPEPPRALDEAHRRVDEAADSTEVNRYAHDELVRTRGLLARADGVWYERRDSAQASHLAYLAAQHARLALNVAAQRAAEARIEAADAERERLRADLATRHTQLAQLSTRGAANFGRTPAQNAQAESAADAERTSRLKRDLHPFAPRPTDHGVVLVLQDDLFDASAIHAAALSRIDRLATVMRRHPQRRVRIEGFTDSTGTSDANRTLSMGRAEAVRQALVVRGVAPERIELRGHGELRPVASNATPAGRQQNRRVEVMFSDVRGQFGLN